MTTKLDSKRLLADVKNLGTGNDEGPFAMTSLYYIECCDCSLCHVLKVHRAKKTKDGKCEIVPNDKPIILELVREDEGTDISRKEKGIKITREKRPGGA